MREKEKAKRCKDRKERKQKTKRKRENQTNKARDNRKHRVAITNNRISAIENGSVRFSYRDRSDDNRQKELTISAHEFVRRFLMHVLPSGFTKIRYYGFLAHANKKACIELIRTLIGVTTAYAQKLEENVQQMMLRLTGVDICCCPQCGKGKLVYVRPLARSAYDDTS